jgi:GNAT superfamily N-acetyltransferase
VCDILAEAAAWLERRGMAMWRLDELAPERVAADIAARLFFIAWCNDDAAGTVKFQLEDALFWPDLEDGTAAYVHRLAVRRRHAGGAVSAALLEWAVREAHRLGRRTLRLDCEASRANLRAVYERFGFRYHSDRYVGPYHVARYEYPLPR